jgi:4-amino-4-deoxy-L-arabinose transferase-like glycosyltransferase
MKNISKEKFFILILFFSLVFFFKRSCLGLPAFADEFHYINGALAVYHNNLNPFVSFWAYKPPLLYEITAALYKLFGYSLEITRLPILFYSVVTLYFTFLLGEKIYNKQTGFWAGILLFFSPSFFVQTGLFYSDILVAALTLSTIYFFLTEKRVTYVLSAALLVLTKELGVLVVVSIAIYQFFFGVSKIRGTLFVLSPLLVFIGWMLLNKFLLGWFLYPVWTSLIFHYNYHQDLAGTVLKTAFWSNARFIITGIIFLYVVSSLLFKNTFKEKLFKKEIILFAILSVLGVIGLGGLDHAGYGYVPRYLLFIQPLFFIIGTACIFHFIKNRTVAILVCGVISCFFIFSWDSNDEDWYDLNMTYRELVRTHKEAAEFLADKFPSATIITEYQFKVHLIRPEFGYVSRPLTHVRGDLNLFTKAKEEGIILVSTFYANWNDNGACIKNFVQQTHPEVVARFISPHDEIGLYAIHADSLNAAVLAKDCHD